MMKCKEITLSRVKRTTSRGLHRSVLTGVDLLKAMTGIDISLQTVGERTSDIAIVPRCRPMQRCETRLTATEMSDHRRYHLLLTHLLVSQMRTVVAAEAGAVIESVCEVEVAIPDAQTRTSPKAKGKARGSRKARKTRTSLPPRHRKAQLRLPKVHHRAQRASPRASHRRGNPRERVPKTTLSMMSDGCLQMSKSSMRISSRQCIRRILRRENGRITFSCNMGSSARNVLTSVTCVYNTPETCKVVIATSESTLVPAETVHRLTGFLATSSSI